jgi:hypothetical protein
VIESEKIPQDRKLQDLSRGEAHQEQLEMVEVLCGEERIVKMQNLQGRYKECTNFSFEMS